jgi:hypothetical protein
MAKFLKRVKTQMKEREIADSIRRLPVDQRPILAYAEDDYSWNQLGPYLSAVMTQHNVPVVYVTSDDDDPILSDHDDRMTVFAIRDTVASFIPTVDSPVFFTTMPDLDSYHIKRPKLATCVYAFHSLTSINMVYRKGAFDAYDAFFCAGPHHMEELTRHFSDIGKPDVRLLEVGYPKLDRIHAEHVAYQKVHPDDKTILIAPSWGKHNVLTDVGDQLIDGLSNAGYRVVVRPHPAFFESIYPEGEAIVRTLQAAFNDRANVIFETSITSENSFMEADLMVSDWSGAAFEYALGTQRPVLFVDVPPKINNPNWQQLGITPFEDRMRNEVGMVVAPTGSDAIDGVSELITNADSYRAHLGDLRASVVYNPGTAAQAGAAALVELSGS